MKPRWILSLILALALASVFVLLSQWQFSESEGQAPPPVTSTEQVKPLTEVFEPGVPLFKTEADQRVSTVGAFVPGTQLLIPGRLQDNRKGLWVVNAFAVSNAPASADGVATVIPVVRGWVPGVEDAPGEPGLAKAAVVGRLLPTEAPVAGEMPQGQVATLSVAQLINIWDRPSYSGFISATNVTFAGQDATPVGNLEHVEVGPQPQETPVNWLNIFYAIEWFVFAGFAFFLWWRLVADDYRRELEDAADAAEAADSQDLSPSNTKEVNP